MNMYTLVKSKFNTILDIQDKLLEQGVMFFTLLDFQRIFHISPLKAKYFLETNTRRGLFIRLKKGLYSLKKNITSEEEIANALYKPSYISFEYALARYNIIPEMAYSVTSATTKPTRAFEVGEKIFTYYTIQKKAFMGYVPEKIGKNVILFAEPEKAFVDYMYFVSLGKKTYNERINASMLNKKKVMYYAKIYNRPGLLHLIKKYDKR